MSWKTKLVVLVIVFLIGIYVGASAFSRTQIEKTDSTISSVNFSPNGGCENQVVSWINRANSSIHVLIYSFTLDSIREALVGAQGKGIDVRVVFEKSEIDQYNEYRNLTNAGIDTRNDTNPKLMHDKVMIIDGTVVLTGSYNWSENAEEHNNENLVVITSSSIAHIYENEFQKIWNSATP